MTTIPTSANVPGIVCGDCELTGGPFTTRAEATLLACLHDHLLHRGRVTAVVIDGEVCESCRQAPGTTAWGHPAAGAPFALCERCATATAHVGGGERS